LSFFYLQQDGIGQADSQHSVLSTQQVGAHSAPSQQVLFVPTKAVPIANKIAVPVIKKIAFIISLFILF
jgi:hypothetical protein